MPGWAKIAPHRSSAENSSTGPTTSSIPSGSARVASTASTCGCRSSAAKNRELFDVAVRLAMPMASAAAVASSRRLALAIGSPVRSSTMVWKLSSASRRPCAISGWYGVYAVYQAGFSSTLRWMAGGVTVP